ncbi:MAG: sensor histidine kinase [Pseudomonadota bacterium]
MTQSDLENIAQEQADDTHDRDVRFSDAPASAFNVSAQTLLHEISHRVAGSLQIAASLARQAEREIVESGDTEKSVEVLRRVRRHVVTIALVQRLLYGETPAKGRFSHFVETLGEHLKTIHDRPNIAVRVKERATVETRHAQSIGLILCELIANALRHGFYKEDEGSVEVAIERDAQGKLHLRIEDNGRGFSGALPIRPEHGMELVADLVEECGATLRQSPQRRGLAHHIEFRG